MLDFLIDNVVGKKEPFKVTSEKQAMMVVYEYLRHTNGITKENGLLVVNYRDVNRTLLLLYNN